MVIWALPLAFLSARTRLGIIDALSRFNGIHNQVEHLLYKVAINSSSILGLIMKNLRRHFFLCYEGCNKLLMLSKDPELLLDLLI
jgi:hypothetical protein